MSQTEAKYKNNGMTNFLPGFAMGVTRSVISHPFEILKIRAQLNVNNKLNVYRGLHYSVLATGLERGCQFYLYDYFRGEKNNSNLSSSMKASCLSTIIAVPYNFYMVNKAVINKDFRFSMNNLSKAIPLEYSKSFLGSSIFLYTYNRMIDEQQPLWLSAFAGTTAVWSVTYPIDNVRNQIIGNNYNFKNLYRGVQYPILRSIPSSIIGMYVYENIKKMLQNNDKN